MQKQILLTGATGGLGKEVVNKLTDAGFDLHLNVREGKTDAFSTQKSISTYVADLTAEAQAADFVTRAIEAAGKIDAAVLLAGGYAPGKVAATMHDDIDKMLEINFFTAFHLVKPLMAHFDAQGGGQFVFIGARPALVASQGAGNFAYALSKSLVFSMAEMINAEGEGRNITATVIVPSTIDTPTNRQAMPDADFSKWIQPAAIADAIAFTLSETGKTLRQTVLKLYNQA